MACVMDVHRLTRWSSVALALSVLLIPAVALGQVEPGGVFCRDAEGCDRTGTVAESWLQIAVALAAVVGTWVVASRQVRAAADSLMATTVEDDPVAAASSDRLRNVDRVAGLARLARPDVQRRALLEGAALGAVGAVVLVLWLGRRTGGEWALIAGGIHLVVFALVFGSATFLVVQAPARAVRSVFGMGVAAGLILGWAATWYIVEPLF